ncbi:helix-turn-helix domain-containing protein [Streptomyces sp. NPDC087532]|uniref:helix-turn-helix domain-containing protein n=1 Tax=Streptomyces sp. NPDC087532 TaxID=3365795 RepID=UPI0037F91AC1
MAINSRSGRRCSLCGGWLSSYNKLTHCAACKSGVANLPDWIWELPDIRQALSEWDFGYALRLIRDELNMSQRDMSDLSGLKQASLSEIESGKSRLTHIDKITSLLQRLQVPAHVSPVAVPGLPAPAASAQWESPARIADRLTASIASNTSATALILHGREVAYIVSRYEAEGATRLAPEVLDLRNRLQGKIEGQQPAKQRRSLFALAAQASALLGYMAVNAGRTHIADAYCEEAYALATAAEDEDLQIWILGTRSLAAYYDRDYTEALAWADQGIGMAPQSAQAIRLLVNGRARALGKLKDRAGAERAIGLAEELSSRHDTPPGLTSCISFEPYGLARTLANAATAHVALGNSAEVLRYAGEINGLVERSDSAWSQALVRLDVASALLAGPQRDVEQAMLLGRQVLEAEGSPPILSVVQRAHDLNEQASAFSDITAVRDYHDALAEWGAAPGTSELARSATMTRKTQALGRTAGETPSRRERVPLHPSLQPG